MPALEAASTRSRENLGDILMRLKLVNDEQVQAALALQKETGKLFGECLLQLGYVGEDDVSWALSSQLGLPYVSVNAEMADTGLLGQFPRDFLRRNLVLPLLLSDEALSVVLADPTDQITLARLRRISGRPLNVAVGTPSLIKAALDDLLGPNGAEGPAEEGEDGALPLAERVGASLASPEFTRLLDRALTEGASAIHIDPDDKKLRVRFRTDYGLTEGGRFEAQALEELVGSLKGWLGPGEEILPGVQRWEGDEEAPLPVRVVAVRSRRGLSLSVMLEPGGLSSGSVTAAFEPEWERLSALLDRPSGLVLGVAPSPAERRHLLSRILGQIDVAHRRAWVLAPEEVLPPKRFSVYPGGTGRGVCERFAEMPGVDVIAALCPDLGAAAALTEASDRDRLVVAVLPGRSALSCLSRMLEAGVSPVLLASSLLAAAAQRVIPGAGENGAGRALAEILFADRDLRRALQDGGRAARLRSAARRQGFVELAARAARLEPVDARIVDELERNRYLEDAA